MKRGRVVPKDMQKTGVDSSALTLWKEEIIRGGADYEESVQEMALLQMKYFVNSFVSALKMQSWYRMMRYRRPFLRHRKERRKVKRDNFQAWALLTAAELFCYRHQLGQPFKLWHNEVIFRKRADALVVKVFNNSLSKVKLSLFSCAAFYNVSSSPTTIVPDSP